MTSPPISNRRVFVAVALVAGLGLWSLACGRDGVTGCKTNGDCASSLQCVGGTCVAGADGGEPDGSGGCFVRDNRCVKRECAGDAGCALVRCDLGCKAWQTRKGCSCGETSCNNQSACGEYACKGGRCGPCESKADCPDDMRCVEDGRCLEGSLCESDSDCAPDRRCNAEGKCVERGECLVDDDCAEGESCFNGQCTSTPDCEKNDDCPEGSECVGGKCYASVCRGNDDCAQGEICNAGECVAPDPTVDRCIVATPDQKISKNQRVRLEAFAVDGSGNGVAVNFQWKSSAPRVASAGNRKGQWSEAKFAVGGGDAGTAELSARVAGGSKKVKCEGKVRLTNLGDVDDKSLRVVVTDAETGSPVEDARVLLGGGGFARTNASGVAQLSRPNGAYTVSVFDDEHNYVTLKGVKSPDIRVPLLPREGAGPTAGFTGKFDPSKIHTSGDVMLGLAGASIPGGLLQVGLGELLGKPFVRSVRIPGQGRADVALPGGMTLSGQVAGFDVTIKPTYYATTPGGARLSWGMAGRISGTRLIQLFRGGGTSNLLPQLLPLFNRFDHTVRPLQLSERSRITDSSDIDRDGDTSEKVPDYKAFPKVGLRPSVRQKLVTSVSVSNFPKLPNGRADFAVLVGGNLLPSTGFVPLGISATTDEDGDGAPDIRRLSMAPPHGPLTGGRFAVMALAFRDVGFDPTSGIDFSEEFSAALWTRQTLSKQVGLGVFPNASSGKIVEKKRRVKVDTDAGPLFRIQLVGDKRTWEVWKVGGAGKNGQYEETIEVPATRGATTDLFKSAKNVYVDAVEVSVTMDDIVKATGIGLRRAGVVATAFNRTKLD